MNAIQMMLITVSHNTICVLASTSHEYACRNTNANAVMNHSVIRCHLSNSLSYLPHLLPMAASHTGLPVFVTYSGRGACAFRPDEPSPHVVRFRVHLGGRPIRTIQPTTEGADTHF